MSQHGIWVRLIKKGKIAASCVQACAADEWEDALTEACHALDVPKPVILPRHERDYASFRQARFLPEHFIESLPYDRMEVEYIDPEARSKVNEKYL